MENVPEYIDSITHFWGFGHQEINENIWAKNWNHGCHHLRVAESLVVASVGTPGPGLGSDLTGQYYDLAAG